MVIMGYMINRRHFPWLNIRHTVINVVSFDSLIHLDGKKGPLTRFSKPSFQKILDCRSIWLTLENEYHDVARRSLNFASDTLTYRAWYSAFTNRLSTANALSTMSGQKQRRRDFAFCCQCQ